MDHPKLQRAIEDLVRAAAGHLDQEHPAFLAIIVPLVRPSQAPPAARVDAIDLAPVPAADPGARPEMLTVQETAASLRCSTGHVKKLIAAGTLPSVTIGRLRRVRRSDLDSYIRSLT